MNLVAIFDPGETFIPPIALLSPPVETVRKPTTGLKQHHDGLEALVSVSRRQSDSLSFV